MGETGGKRKGGIREERGMAGRAGVGVKRERGRKGERREKGREIDPRI